MQTHDITCPGCGEPWALGMTECPSCHRPVIISTFNSVYDMAAPEASRYASTYRKMTDEGENTAPVQSAMAMCYLKLRLYDKALAAFERAIEENFDNSETYFWAAVCLLDGKKAFLVKREVIDQAERYIGAAMAIEPRGVYEYFLAYVRYDFFERKYLNVTPNWRDCLEQALALGVTEADKTLLFETLGVEDPFA